MSHLGFREEQRRFRPHLTLGRVRRSPEGVEELGQLILDQTEFAAGTMTVAEVLVYSSRLERTGSNCQ
jgi:2'-5' RNA ligase